VLRTHSAGSPMLHVLVQLTVCYTYSNLTNANTRGESETF